MKISSNPNKPLIVYFNGLTNGKRRKREEWALWPSKRMAHFSNFPMRTNWYEREAYSETLANESALVEGLLSQSIGGVVLVGASAGVSRATNIYGDLSEYHKDLWCVGLCGRVAVGNLRSRDWRNLNKKMSISPQFVESVQYCDEITVPSLSPHQKQGMHIVHPYADEVVPPSTMLIEGVKTTRVPSIEHELSVFMGGVMLPVIISRLTAESAAQETG